MSKLQLDVENLREMVRQRQDALRPGLQKYVANLQVMLKRIFNVRPYPQAIEIWSQDLSMEGVMERLQISVQEAQATCDALTLSGEGQESDLDMYIDAAKQLHFRRALLEVLKAQP